MTRKLRMLKKSLKNQIITQTNPMKKTEKTKKTKTMTSMTQTLLLLKIMNNYQFTNQKDKKKIMVKKNLLLQKVFILLMMKSKKIWMKNMMKMKKWENKNRLKIFKPNLKIMKKKIIYKCKQKQKF